MKKNILFLAVFCLSSVISFAGEPGEPIQLAEGTSECQLMMMPSVQETSESIVEHKVITLAMSDGCLKYAVEAAHAEQAFYGTSGGQELQMLATGYYGACKFAGGAKYMLAPIFL